MQSGLCTIQDLPGLSQSGASTPTVLVVEDEPALLDLLKLFLEDERYRVLFALSGEQALRLVAEEEDPPQLFLLDYLLPGGMNGLALYDRLHALPGFERVPAIMTSACLTQARLQEELLSRGIEGIEKPYDLEALLERINAAVRSAQSAR